jgi:phosphatidylserine/phosphatidylglycerophosphate/cardiolipin synthase-like enzyme
MYKLFFLFLITVYTSQHKPLIAEDEITILFSPEDKPRLHLLDEISKATRIIYAAIYMLTDKKVALALIDAKQNRGIDVQIITDRASADSPYGKVALLRQANIPIYVFTKITKKPTIKNNNRPLHLSTMFPVKLTEAQLQTSFKSFLTQRLSPTETNGKPLFSHLGLMHEKFGIFDDTIWLGSFNWTLSANSLNKEDIVIFKNKKVLNRLLERFENLKKESSLTGPCHPKQLEAIQKSKKVMFGPKRRTHLKLQRMPTMI